MSFYLLAHANPSGPNYYTTRRGRLLAIVMHCTAGLEDTDLHGADTSAEATARYAATTGRAVSWHSGSDTDSFLTLLPAGYTAWHCKGYNSITYGHEISKLDMTWADEPAAWVAATLAQAARGLAKVAAAHRIPVRHATRAELDRAITAGGPPVGFIGHDVLDPTRRTDPGRDFPWSRFLALVEASLTQGVDDMGTFEGFAGDGEQRFKTAVRSVLNEGTGKGQSSFAGTVEATLAKVEAVANLVNSTSGALAAQVTDRTTAILTVLAALPTDHLSDEDQAEIVEALRDLDATAILDALHARLAA